MASTYSPSLKLELIGQGEQSGTWGVTTNNNFGSLVEQAITGVQTITMSDAQYTLSSYDGAVDEARNAVLVLIGTNTGPQNLIAPAAEKLYVINNQTGATVTIKTSGGNGIAVLNSATAQVYCDGTNFYSAAASTNSVTGNFSATGNVTAGNSIVAVNGVYTGNVAIAGSLSAGSITGVTGRIVQIKSSTFGGAPATSSGTQISTGHSLSITPSSTSSTIMVLYFGNFAQSNFNAGPFPPANAFLNMCRNSGALFSGANMAQMNINVNTTSGSIYGSASFNFVDSPNSTSAQVYEIFYSANGGATNNYNGLGGSTITLLEIL